jgi:hypothetical protein
MKAKEQVLTNDLRETLKAVMQKEKHRICIIQSIQLFLMSGESTMIIRDGKKCFT